MAQETTMRAKDQQMQQNDQIGDDEVSELLRPPSFYHKVREQAERFASTRLGQFVIERADRGLKLIEDTTKWSLPQDKNSSAVTLERPLPWAPFLLLIIVLRLARIWLSIGALMIGNGPVSPADMIYFIQTRRRKLRAIRVHGLRVMRNRQQESSSWTSHGYVQKLSQWVSRAICRPGVQRANNARLFNVSAMEAKNLQANHQNRSAAKRPRSEEEPNADCNLTIDEMLSKYANENSEDDSDFVPNPEEEESSGSSSSSDSESESHNSEQISSNEEQENAEQHKENLKPNQNEQNHVQKSKDQPAILNGNANGNEKDQTEVAAVKDDDQWKSTPGHMNAAQLNTRLFNNNTAAAATTEAGDIAHDPQPDPTVDSNNASHSDTDSSSTSTVCPQPPTQYRSELSEDIVDVAADNTNSITTSPTTATTNPDPNANPESDPETPASLPEPTTVETLSPAAHPDSSVAEIPTPAYQDLSTESLLPVASSDLSNIDTLTPATSSEDIFYSPIGSPNNFNNGFVNQSVLRKVIINAVPTHSTPNSELDEIFSAGSELEEATRQCIALAHSREEQDTSPTAKQTQPQPQQQPQQQQQQHQQQHQRQFNHSHQRFRGRNRR